MTTLNRQVLKMITDEIESAIAHIGKKYDVEIKYKSGSFTPSNASLKFTVNTISDNGDSITKETSDFVRYAKFYGFSVDDLNKTFNYCNEKYTVVGLKASSKKYPILCKREDGKMFKMTAQTVKALL